MAFTPNNNLKSDAYVTLHDYAHAARLFADDQFRLAPKHKFLFHVAFGINESALKMIDISQRHKNEVNMLVKSVDFPKYTVSTETLNQYNRKKVVQYTHKLDPINVKLHDDNMSLISTLWWNYYSYYYADPTTADTTGSYNRTATRSSDFINSPYGLDNGSTEPFFKYIKIYQMARHEYMQYTLINPTITSWAHGSGSYSDSGLNEQAMTIAYEAVSYNSGSMSGAPPEGFGIEHYDQTTSTLTGNATGSASPSFAQSLNVLNSSASILDSVITQINTAQNTKQSGTVPNGTGLTTVIPKQAIGGLQGFRFPVVGK